MEERELTPEELAAIPQAPGKVNKGASVWYDSGKGKIYVARAPREGMVTKLFYLTCQAVDDLRFSIVVSSVDTGKHAPRSRHYTGRAEDISDVHVYGEAYQAATMANEHARRLVEWFIAHGFHAGRESGAYNAVLFGPVGGVWNKTSSDHSDHIHSSVYSP